MKQLLYIATALLFVACEPTEVPVQVNNTSGDLITSRVEMGSDYTYQHYYDLETQSIVKTQEKSSWHLAFSSTDDDLIWLNDANLAAISYSTKTFENTTDTVGSKWRYDSSSHKADSSAIGNWSENLSRVYIMNLGFNEIGQSLGIIKFQMLPSISDAYQVRCAALDNAWDSTLTISKDTEYNFSHLAFNSTGVEQLLAEPKKDEWDLLFSQYTHFFVDENLQYLVTGVLFNAHEVAGFQDSISGFENINLATALDGNFSAERNLIGYDWKVFNFSNSTYETNPDKHYVVQSTEGKFFKMRFLDFYSDTGEKGAPLFELQEL